MPKSLSESQPRWSRHLSRNNLYFLLRKMLPNQGRRKSRCSDSASNPQKIIKVGLGLMHTPIEQNSGAHFRTAADSSKRSLETSFTSLRKIPSLLALC